MNFQELIFEQDNAPVHKSRIIGNFSKKWVDGTGMAGIQSRYESSWNLWAILI